MQVLSKCSKEALRQHSRSTSSASTELLRKRSFRPSATLSVDKADSDCCAGTEWSRLYDSTRHAQSISAAHSEEHD